MANNKCKIPRKDSNSAPTQAELLSFISQTIMPSLRDIYNNPNYKTNGTLSPSKARLATIDFIKSLGVSYYASEYKYIEDAFKLCLSMRAFNIFDKVVPKQTIQNILKSKGTAEVISSNIFTDRIEDDDSSDYDAVDYFLNNAYGTAVLAKKQVLRKMNNIVLNSFIVDRQEGIVISNITDALHKVEVYKRQLFNDIYKYFESINKDLPITAEELIKLPTQELINKCKTAIAEELAVGLYSGSDLLKLYELGYSTTKNNLEENEKAVLKLTAYGSWLALQHFDNFIKMTVGDTIIINPSSQDRYSYSSKGTNINTTWRKDDNIDLLAEINKLTQALINTSPMFLFGLNLPINGAYLNFGDFSYITAKIKDLVYNINSSNIILKKDSQLFNSLTAEEQSLVLNKSLRLIISHSRYNPQKYIPLIFKILVSSESDVANTQVLNRFDVFNSLDKNLIWTIYKNLYEQNFNEDDSTHSLYSIQLKNSGSKNYYGAVSSVADCIFSVDFVQYAFDNGVLKLRTLRDAAVDKTKKEIENIINTKNSSQLLGLFNFEEYGVSEIITEEQLKGITFKLETHPGKFLYIHVKDLGEHITFSENPGINGAALNTTQIKELFNNQTIKTFIDNVLGLNLSQDAEFRRTYQELTKEGTDDISPYVKDILGLASHVFFHRYFSLKYLDGLADRYKKLNSIRSTFIDEKKRPKFNNNFFTMDMIPPQRYKTVLTLAQALGTTRGVNSSAQVKDSDNAMLSSQTLSRLLGNLIQLLDVQIGSYNLIKKLREQIAANNKKIADPSTIPARKENLLNENKALELQIADIKTNAFIYDSPQNPAAANFSLITNPNLFKGMLKSEEIKGIFGNKKQVKFTTAEAVLSSFLHNFVLGHCNLDVLDSNSPLGGGVVGLLPSVNSDKTTVSVAKFNLNARVREGSTVTYMDLKNPELIKQIQIEIGTFYTTMYNNVESDFKLLQNSTSIILNPNTNFKELNDFVDLQNAAGNNITAAQVLFDLTNEYNQKHPQHPIRLIDQVHYVEVGNHIQMNNTLKALKKRFTDDKETIKFFNLKNTEVLKSALDAGFVVNLYGNSNLNNLPEINYLRENHPDWINQSGQMVLARVNLDGKVYDITTKSDLNAVEKVMTLKRMLDAGVKNPIAEYNQNPYQAKKDYGVDNLINKIHLLKDNIQLHPMLERYNLMDYLFTQQIMCSTVGSHIAHPSKAKIKTPIIWAHPAIGKTELIDAGTHADKFMDWDVEFNGRRDAWIAQHSKTKLGTKAFKQARTKYLLKWEEIPEFLEFVKSEWERIKEKAKSENKILVASPHMLLTMFSDEFDSVLTMSLEDFIKRSTARGDTDPINWKIGIDDTINELSSDSNFISKVKQINDGEYLTTLVEQGKLQKELDILTDNEMAEEAARFYAQHKRNVSFTAAMDQFQLNQIDGIPLWYNISIIDDIKEELFTADGNTDKAKPYDGATYVNPIIMYLENNSLNEARAGIDKKQFVHFYDELTGTGGIIKTAGFALTNDRIRNAIFYRDMMKNMTDHVWKDYLGNDYIADITTNYKGESVNYGEFYYKEDNKYYRASIRKADGPNAYIKTVTEVNKYGADVGESIDILQENINTNYKLWQMFGGMHSLIMNGGMLEPSETSIQLVTKAVINTGKVKPSGYNADGTILNDITAQHIDLPLKNADIHYMPTIGAVKQGAANINPKSFYKGEHNLNFFRIRMTNAGIQLDKEHHADSSKLSLMTQVISSACSMGYTPKQATRLYKALYNLTMLGIKEFKDGFKEILNSKDPSKFETAIADCMIKNMITSTALDGDMLRAIAHDLIEKARKGLELTFADTKSIPYSDPAVFEKLVTNLSVMMTKAGIKALMNGILSVLCPTLGIVKMYNFVDPKTKQRHNFTLSQLEEFYGKDYNQVIDWLLENQEWRTEIKLTDIEIGNKYLVKLKNGTQVVMNIKYPHDVRTVNGNEEIVGYKAFKNLVRSGAVEGVQEYIKDGKELGSINYKFKGTDGFDYQIWDIDFIQDLFAVVAAEKKMETDEEKLAAYQQLIIKYDGDLTKFNSAVQNHFLSYKNGGNSSTPHMLRLTKRYAKAIQQDILFALSKGNSNKIFEILVDGQPVTIDKDSIQVQPYEIVMPKIFLQEFGLDLFSNLDEIINNPDYFIDRMKSNFDTKVLDEVCYDIELKRINGDHIYIKDKSGALANWNLDLEKVTIYKKRDELGKLWRIDLSTNKKMYELFDESDEVYRIPGTDTEIIATSNKITTTLGKDGEKGKQSLRTGITFYLNNFKYQSIHISEAVAAGKNDLFSKTERPLFENIMDMVRASKNKCAKSWINLFDEYNRAGQIELNKELNTFDELSETLKKHLKEEARIIHTSLLKSLDIIAARIPAQNQQSFMPMKVVAWENPNVNTAYVSVMQFFLQGSDLDIDAVSLLTHSFGKNGLFHEWSPDFDMRNIDFLNMSINLPFPSGKDLEIINYEDHSEVLEANRQASFIENSNYNLLLELENKKLEIANRAVVTAEEKSQQLAEYELVEKEALKAYIALLEDIENSDGVIYFKTKAELNSALNIIDRINKHNTYLVGVSDSVSTGAIKNYLVSLLYNISTDAANLLEAHTGVDVATGPLKKIANASYLSEVQKTFTPGNVFNKYQAIEEASVGKDDIAICATGLKGFFASTLHCNRYLNQVLQNTEQWRAGEADNVSSIIKFEPVTIGGRTFSTLANIRVDDLAKVDPNSQIYQELRDKGFDDDASVIMSALLSLSTDNAKELCLAKINAGTSMIGLYLYGAAIGMDFEVLNKIIASPLGFTIAKLINSNEFTLQKGKTSVDAALSYLYDGPGKREISKYNVNLKNESGLFLVNSFDIFNNAIQKTIETYSDDDLIASINAIVKDRGLSTENIGKVLSLLTRSLGAIRVSNFLATVNKETRTVISSYEEKGLSTPTDIRNFSAMSNQFYDFLIEFVDQARTLQGTSYTTAYGDSNIAEDLNKLALGADEFKRLGLFLRLNLEIKTKSDELIDFVQKIETCITERVKLLKRVNKRLGQKYEVEELENFDFIKFANSFINDPNNPNAYHNLQVELYEKYCKSCINPLRVLTTVDHYKGYLESLIMAYQGDFLKSVKFRAIKTIGNTFINANDISSKLDKTYVMKGVQSLVNDYINNAYLRSKPLFKLPQSTKTLKIEILDKYGNPQEVGKENAPIALGTKEGNTSFEYFFENIFIPQLKKLYGNNEFVQNLATVLVTDSNSGSKYLAVSLPINMMPSSDNERALLNSFKNAFTNLDGRIVTIGNLEYSIVRMFHYYNLLKFKGKGGRSSLLSIFEDIMARNNDLKSYRTFINHFDETYDFTLNDFDLPLNEDGRTLIKLSLEVVDLYLAPLSNPFISNSRLIKFKDLVIGLTVLLERQDDKPQQNIEDSEEFGDYLDLYNDYDGETSEELYMGMEDFDMSGEYTPDYGAYKRIDDGGLRRFDPNVPQDFNASDNILSDFNTGSVTVQNVVIEGGLLKSFYNPETGEIIKVTSKKSMVKLVTDRTAKDVYILDEETLSATINQKLCGK